MRKLVNHLIACIALSGLVSAQAPAPSTSTPIESTRSPLFKATSGPCDITTTKGYSNFRLSLNYSATTTSKPKIILHDGYALDLPKGENRQIEIAYEHLGTLPARIRIWEEGKLIEKGRNLPNSKAASHGNHAEDPETSHGTLRMDRDFTAMIQFKTNKQGTLIAKAPATGKWVRDAKALYIRKGRLVYDIGFLGAIQGKTRVNDGKPHVAVLISKGGNIAIYLDGSLEAKKSNFTRPDSRQFVFKAGSATADFGGDFQGTLSGVRFWKRSLNATEIKQLSTGKESSVNTSDYHWKAQTPAKPSVKESIFGHSSSSVPGFPTKIKLQASTGFKLHQATVQPLELSDHAALIRGWDKTSLKRGQEIYKQLCLTCHGDLKKPGSLPTALRFHQGPFKNGSDPYRMLHTLQRGYGQMAPQPQYTTAQKYDLVHYIRDTFLKGKNESQLTTIDTAYLNKLPRGMSLMKEKEKKQNTGPQYLQQDYGNTLFWTLQVDKGNIAQKGIAIRMDEGPGGISKGNSWMLYDHDTMRLAACWSGDKFVDWRGIAFDGSHGSHTSIVGEKHFISPNLPMWANPKTGDFKDTRILGRDNRPYGPLPKSWVHFKGLEIHNGKSVLRYTVGDCTIRELPEAGVEANSYKRTFFCSPTSTELKLRLDGERVHVIPASDQPSQFSVIYTKGKATVVAGSSSKSVQAPSAPVSKRFSTRLSTTIVRGSDEGPFAIDVLTPPAPDQNPWESWMRTTGFDFFANGTSAAVCTWNGDVWIVDGIDQASGTLTWQRICSGLFQPLGLKIVDGEIYVGCRDMIAKLTDLNGDRETDLIESFNNDHQVTEHFHEFAMGLQTDTKGNFYYAKSARHAKVAVVPHHGTLLRVSKDGTKTDIIATGFRAANGVCINPDGTFIVTDQEGHWNPKNRINWVKGSGVDDFYGNMYGYHNVTDDSDSAMTPPLCWITNSFDRSPAELIWVPSDSAWKSLRGSLLNLSYGYGKIHVVPHEEVNGQKQGGLCQLPFKQFPTGIMRGRFHPNDGQLYGCGMYAWAGNQKQPGGFYRIRATQKPAHAPIGLNITKQTVTITFTDALDPKSIQEPKAWTIEAWDLKRTKSYGSKHHDQRKWAVKKASLSADGKTVTLTIPDLAPTWGMSIKAKVLSKNGNPIAREIHNSIHQIPGN